MYERILLPVDLSEPSSWVKARTVAVEHCKAFGSKLHLTTVVPDFRMTLVAEYFPAGFERQAVAKAAEELSAFAAAHVPDDVAVEESVRYGSVYEEILRAARKTDCDLIIMAAYRPALEDYLIGPNAARVVRHAKCSVLVVRD